MIVRRMLLVAALAVAASVSLAQDPPPCVDYADYLHRLGRVATSGDTRDVVRRGDLAFTATANGLQAFDLADPADPQPAGNLGGYVLERLLAAGDHVWAIDNADRLRGFDAADPAAMSLVASLPLREGARDLAVTPDLARLLVGDEFGLQIVDITDPAAPRLAGSFDTPLPVFGVAALSGVAVLAGGEVRLVDIRDPDAPLTLATVVLPSPAIDVADDGSRLLVVTTAPSLTIIDAGNPATPSVRGTVGLPLGGSRVDLGIGDSVALVAGNRGLYTVDTSLTDAPAVLGHSLSAGFAAAAVRAGDAVLTACGGAGLEVHAAPDPASPPPVATAPTTGSALGLAMAGDYLLAACGTLDIFDRTDPAAPVLVASLDMAGNAARVVVSGDHAFVSVAGGPSSVIRVVDIADPAAPHVIAGEDIPGYSGPMVIAGATLYVGDFFFGGIQVVDISDPAAPRFVATAPTDPYVIGLAAGDGVLYAGIGAFGDAVFTTFDLADPLAPVPLGAYALGAEAVYGMAAAGPVVYAAVQSQTHNGVHVLDVANPAAPRGIGYAYVPGALNDIAYADGVVYTVGEQATLHAVSVETPGDPVAVGETFLPDAAYVVMAEGGLLWAAATDAGVAVLPLHCDPDVGIDDQGDDDGDGDTPPAVDVLALDAYPNPFNPQVTLRFSLPGDGPVTLDVFDVAGRRVARLVRGEMAAGDHAVTWRAPRAAAGVYLARLETSDGVRACRVALVR